MQKIDMLAQNIDSFYNSVFGSRDISNKEFNGMTFEEQMRMHITPSSKKLDLHEIF